MNTAPPNAPPIAVEPRTKPRNLAAVLAGLPNFPQPARPVAAAASPFTPVFVEEAEEAAADEAAAARIEEKLGRPAESAAHAFDGIEVGDDILIGDLPTAAQPVPHIGYAGTVVAKTDRQVCIRDAAGDLLAVHKASWNGWYCNPVVHLALALLLLLPGCSAFQPGPLGLSYDPITGTWTGTATIIPKPGGKEPVQ